MEKGSRDRSAAQDATHFRVSDNAAWEEFDKKEKVRMGGLAQTFLPQAVAGREAITTPEDIYQTAVLQVLEKSKSGGIQEISKYFVSNRMTWRATDICRKNNVEKKIFSVIPASMGGNDAIYDDTPGPQERMLTKEKIEKIREYVENLSPEQRKVIVLYADFALSSKEIAEMTGKSYASVKMILMRGRKRLQEMLAEDSLFSA